MPSLRSMKKKSFNDPYLKSALLENFYALNLESIEDIFSGCNNLKSLKLDGILKNVNSSKIKSLEGILKGSYCINNFHMENIFFEELTSMENLFGSNSPLCAKRNIELINITAPKLITMEKMFIQSTFDNIIFENFKAHNLAKTNRMFESYVINENIKLEGILENINVSKITSIEEIFRYTSFTKGKSFSFENIHFLELESIEKMLYGSNNIISV